MNRQWMYGERCTSKFITGLQNFIVVAEANSDQNGFMFCPCVICQNKKDYSYSRTLHTHMIRLVSCPAIIVGSSTEKEGLRWKTMKNKRMMTTILCSPSTVILQRGKLKIKRHQMSRLMILVVPLLMTERVRN